MRCTRFSSKTIRKGCPNVSIVTLTSPMFFRKIDDLVDDQSKSDNILGSVRARARAIIMDNCGLPLWRG